MGKRKPSSPVKSEVMSSITSGVSSPIKARDSRQFREAVTRVGKKVIGGKPTAAKQSNRWSV
jgi:hypothetical protein